MSLVGIGMNASLTVSFGLASALEEQPARARPADRAMAAATVVRTVWVVRRFTGSPP